MTFVTHGPVCVLTGRLRSCQDVLPAGPASKPWIQTFEGELSQAAPAGEKTDRRGVTTVADPPCPAHVSGTTCPLSHGSPNTSDQA